MSVLIKTKAAKDSSNQTRNILIAVAWPYVNGDIHIGHLAGYLLPADVVARYHRLAGNNVLMVSGSDCFGTPITVEADKRNISPAELVEEYHPRTARLFSDLKISFDIYTRTTTQTHNEVVQEFFLTLLKKGLVVKGVSAQYYSDAEGRFLPDRYVEGTCPVCHVDRARSDQCDSCGSPLEEGRLLNPVSKISGAPVVLKDSEHYFLDWPKLTGFLNDYFERSRSRWRPWVDAETAKWLRQGLKPRAITRDLNWGVPIPSDRIAEDQRLLGAENKRIYVWFEAVIGYLSASKEWAALQTGRDWRGYWINPDAYHYYFMGKDNLVFHTVFWPGQLHGFDESLHLPDEPAINHFLTYGGEKFSKSRGVFVDPGAAAATYGLDALRFFLCRIAPETSDADFTFERLVETNNGVLVATIGNFINRTLNLAQGLKFSGKPSPTSAISEAVDTALQNAATALERARLRDYVNEIVLLATAANKFISEQAPWALRKEGGPKYDLDKFYAVMADAAYIVLGLNLMMRPLMPETAIRLDGMIGGGVQKWSSEPAKELVDALKSFAVVNPEPLFPLLELKGVVCR